MKTTHTPTQHPGISLASRLRNSAQQVQSLQAQNAELRSALEVAIATIERLAPKHGPFTSADGTLSVARKALAKP